MNPVELFIYNKEDDQKYILEFLHHWIISTCKSIQPKIRYGIPFYYRNKWVCYLNPLKNGTVEIAFTRANQLRNESGLLQFGTRKQVAGLIIQSIETLPLLALQVIMTEALELDDKSIHATKKK